MNKVTVPEGYDIEQSLTDRVEHGVGSHIWIHTVQAILTGDVCMYPGRHFSYWNLQNAEIKILDYYQSSLKWQILTINYNFAQQHNTLISANTSQKEQTFIICSFTATIQQYLRQTYGLLFHDNLAISYVILEHKIKTDKVKKTNACKQEQITIFFMLNACIYNFTWLMKNLK
jgi:hypothetical protein